MVMSIEDCVIDEYGGNPSNQTQSLIRTYDEMRQEVADQIQKMTQELQNVLRPTRAANGRMGILVVQNNLRRMIQLKTRNQGDLDFWRRNTGFKAWCSRNPIDRLVRINAWIQV